MRWVVAAGVLGAIAFVLSHPPMYGWGEPAYPGWDLTRVFWADLEFARRAVVRGELPLWNPLDRTGYPFLAEPQSGMFDPLTWALVGVALVIGYAPSWLIVVKTVVAFGIGAAGVAAYLRNRRLPAWACCWAAVALCLCPRFDKLKDQSALWPAVWVGWLLLAADRWAAKPSWRAGVWLGVAASVVVNAGYPPTGFRLGLFVAPYLAVVVWTQARRSDDPRAYLAGLARSAAVVGAVVAVLCAGQIWTTLQVLSETKRAALDPGFVTASRTRPEHVLGLFAPSASKQALNLYVSAAGLVAATYAVVRPSPISIVLAVTAVAGFVLGCGDDLPVLPVLAKLPGFRSFRIAGHYLMLTSIAMVLLAAFGLSMLGQTERPWQRWVVSGLVAVELGLWLTLGEGVSAVSIGVVVLSLAALVTSVFVPRRAAPLGWALVALTALDLGVAARPVADILQPLPDRARGYAMAELIGRSPQIRVADYEWAGRRIGPREGIRDFNGHRPALTDPRYMMVYEALPDSATLMRAMNVGLFGVRRRRARGVRHGGVVAVDGYRGLFRVHDPWPVAFFTDSVSVFESAPQALTALAHADGPAAVFESEHFPDGLDPSALDGGSVGEARVVRPDHASLVIDVRAPSRGVLVVAEAYEAGWRATVDGSPAPVSRVNLIGRAVVLEPGDHRVVMRYEPPGARALWWLWLVGLLASLLLLGATRASAAAR